MLEITTANSFKHGMYKTKFYRAWSDSCYRITNQNSKDYNDYGGRGLKHAYLKDFISFMHDYYDEYKAACDLYGEENITLDRIDNNLGYTKGNIRFVTMKVQCENRRDHITQKWAKAIHEDGREFIFNNQRKFSRDHSLDQRHISKCLNGKGKSHKGWKFEYT